MTVFTENRCLRISLVTLFLFLILKTSICFAARSDKIGTTYPSQKVAFKDPVSGKTVWRMTVDGTQKKALNNISDSSGMEGDKFSPDGTKICYAKTGHNEKPDGFYVMDLVSGEETYVGPTGDLRWGACVFSKTTNELFYMYVYNGSSTMGKFGEIRGVNLSTLSTRLLRKLPDVNAGNIGMSLNRDGSYLATKVGVGEGGAAYVNSKVYVVILKTSDGTEHPNWKYDQSTPDMSEAGDHPYWHPTKNNAVRTYRDGVLKIWNIDTLAAEQKPIFMGEADNLYGAHNCITVDGAIQFHTWGHADCHPLDAGKGENTRAVLDRRQAEYPYLYVTAFKNAAGYGVYPATLADVVAVHYNYATGTHNYAHAHPHFSRNGKYVLFASAVNNTVAGTPPGGADNDTYTVDLFVVPLLLNSSKISPPSKVQVK
jgi:hypothetical protein